MLTTSPGAWLAYSGADSVTLFDLTGLIGTSLGSSEQDLRDRVAEQIVAAGWHEKQVGFESVSGPLSKEPRTVQLKAIADIIVFDNEGKPIAVGEA